MLSEAYLGLGSNLGDRAGNIAAGLAFLREISRRTTVSSLYETAPSGFRSQPPFLNAACGIWTWLDPFQLMARLREIEAAVGRQRVFVNAPRMLDMDILTYGGAVLVSPGLTVPHPRMANRAFVLEPLAELAPMLRHPVLMETVGSLLAGLSTPRRAFARRPPPGVNLGG